MMDSTKASTRLLHAAILATTLLAGPAARAAEPPLPERDPHSYANPAQLRVTHVALDLRVDFQNQRLSGTSELQIAHVDPAARELLLDTREVKGTPRRRLLLRGGQPYELEARSLALLRLHANVTRR